MVSELSIFGRGREQGWLEELSQPSSRDKRGLLIVGPSGIGKTTILRWYRSECVRRGSVTAWVRTPTSGAVESTFPLDRVIAGIDPSASAHVQFRLATSPIALSDVIQQIVGGGSLTILVDDIDYMPKANRALFFDSLAMVECSIVVVATSRSHESAQAYAATRTSEFMLDTLRLEGIDETAVEKLIFETLGGPPLPSLTKLLLERTLGNPLYAIESLYLLQRNGSLRRVGEFWGASEASDSLPPSLRELLSTKVSGLSKIARELLSLMTVLGRETSIYELCLAADLGEESAVSAIRELEDQNLVAQSNTSMPLFSLAHRSVGNCLLDFLSIAEIGLLHGRVFDLIQKLETLGSGVSRADMAFHALHSHRVDALFCDLFQQAADEASKSGNHRQAAEWYSQVARKESNTSRSTARIREVAETYAFDPARSVELCGTYLAASTDSEMTGLLLGERAQARRRLGHYKEALSDLRASLSFIGENERWEIEHGVAVMTAILGDPVAAEASMLVLAKDADNHERVAKATGHLGQIAFCGGALRRGRQLFAQSYEIASDVGQRLHAAGNLAWATILLGDWASALEVLDISIPEATRARDYWNLSGLLDSRAKLHAWMGEVSLALDLASRAVSIAQRVGNPAALLSAHQGLALALLEGGSSGDAATTMAQGVRLVDALLEPCELSFSFVTAGDIALALNRVPEAREYCELARANLNTARVWVEAVDRLEAQIELADGNPLVAVAIVRPWIAAPGQVVFEHARMLEVAAHAYLAARDRTSSQSCAQQASDIYNKLGAALRSDVIAKWMAQKLRGPGRPRMRLPGGLTEREHDVLRHVVTGKTNKDIARALTLSVSTVNKHVEHLIFKAGVARRTELVAFAQAIEDPAASLSATEGR